jgi:hypothetical protein
MEEAAALGAGLRPSRPGAPAQPNAELYAELHAFGEVEPQTHGRTGTAGDYARRDASLAVLRMTPLG